MRKGGRVAGREWPPLGVGDWRNREGVVYFVMVRLRQW